MANLTAVRGRVKRYVPNVPDLLVDQALSDAARTFFQRSEAWRVDVPLTFDEGVFSQPVPTTAPMDFKSWYRINHARHSDGAVLHPGDFEGPQPVDWSNTGQDKPKYYGAVGGTTMVIFPRPDQQYTITFNLIVSNSLGATEIADGPYDKYVQEIVHGAAADLLTMAGYEFANPAAAPFHLNKFEAGIAQAHADVRRSRTRADDSVNMVPLA